MRLLLFVSALLTSIPAWSSGCGCFDGFYLGVAGGVATHIADGHLNAQSEFPGFPPGNAETLRDKRHFDVCKNRGWGEIFGGWGRQCNCFYLGGRLGGNFSSFDLKVKSDPSDIDNVDEGSTFLNNSLKTRLNSAEFTFDFKPGWVFCNRSMIFAILGGAVNRTTIKVTSRLSKEEGLNAPAAFDLLQVHKRKTSTGFRAGFGLEQMLTSCLSLQINYVYTWYGKFKRSASQTFRVINPPNPDSFFVHTVDFETKPRKQVASIALAYYF